MRRKALALILVAIIILSFMGTFTSIVIMDSSNAPNLLVEDKILVNRSAYELTIPFTLIKLFSWKNPTRGDLVLCKAKHIKNNQFWMKRIIGIPGDIIQIKNNRVLLNGKQLQYLNIDSKLYGRFEKQNEIGTVVEKELLNQIEYNITYTPQKGLLEYVNYGPILVGEELYFVLGDNRDNSTDSRNFGLLHREHIYGKFALKF
jgi:signal peptidase I